MSKNRENVAWQSADGTWSLGFYDYYASSEPRDEDYGFDDEWDVDYTNKFHWVSTGHPSESSAKRAWGGVNPGGGSTVSYSEENAKTLEALDDEAAQTHIASRSKGYNEYNQGVAAYGTPKTRGLRHLSRQLYNAKLEALGYKYNGYSNLPNPSIPGWEKELKERLKDATAEEIAGLNESRAGYVRGLQNIVDRHQESLRTRARSWQYASPAGKQQLREKDKQVEALQEEINKYSTAVKTPRSKPAAKEASSRAQKFHITPTGQARKCSANVKSCPYGGAEVHFSSREKAREAYESSQGGSF